MAKNYVQAGTTLAITATAAVKSGSLVQAGDVFVVAVTDIRDRLSRMNLITLPPIRQKMPAAAAPGDAPCVTIPETLAVSSPLINFHSKSS